MIAPEAAPTGDDRHEWDRFDRPRTCKTCGFEEHDGSGIGYRRCYPEAAPMREDVTQAECNQPTETPRLSEIEREVAALIASLPDTGQTTISQWVDARMKAAVTKALAHTARPDVHSDDTAVDLFAARMKEKLAAARSKGRHGWNDPTVCSADYLRALLNEHIGKGDPVDVANFCMMLSHREESTARADAGDHVERVALIRAGMHENTNGAIDLIPYGVAVRALQDLRASLAAMREGVDRGMVEVPREVVAFLKGEGPLDGQWFGDPKPVGECGNFWWRKHLPNLAALSRKGEVTG